MANKNKMLQFVQKEREMPAKREAEARREDFLEIYGDYVEAKAEEQASRCSQCGVPFCQNHCPLDNNIPDWLKLTAEGRVKEAWEVSSATNNMPEICGRICPQDRLCEGSCVIEQSGHGTVTIGSVERYLTDTAWEENWIEPIKPRRERAGSVGIIGAGPAGLAAAEQLREQGWQVTVYDRHDRAGGLLIYGIPNFKLEKSIVQRRTKRLEDSGIEFVLNCDVGVDITFDKLREKHQAVLIAAGVYKARDLDCDGSDSDGVRPALPFLIESNKRGLGDTLSAETAEGKNVVVVGGGDTAMDCVRTAIRQGAESVTCLYRRDHANMPGSRRETANAQEEGVTFEWLAAPRTLEGDSGKVTTVKADRMRLGPKDASGRQSPVVLEGAEFDVKADLVIKALGFSPEDMNVLSEELTVTRWGTLRVNPVTFETNLPGVYAAGDIVRGASLVVWAIREGRDAAAHMHSYLRTLEKAEAKVAAE
ncbi:glutamate synthase (NADPH) small subunit [Litorimonas taeanensis]|uniref:Glutamate synthase (NADPH) small subunit n=1 Tax=Litorimonas taeanensis TaxID=568099 RepID=A0A420WL82_9PROT|nr:NAD(P)-dependent oxidoreductase [Litorimonas taeanensis]RKQ71666.1 glutamate synthase (NADPH) small subunit [Litorimonas taeanensis]